MQLQELPTKKQKYVRERVKGKSKTQAALAAGYSDSMARSTPQIETEDVKAVFRSLVQRAAPMDKLAKRLSEGLDACKTEFFQKDGVVTDKRDTIAWSERRAYLELAAEYGGYVAKDAGQSQTPVRVGVMIAVQPQDRLADGPAPSPVIDASTSHLPS